MSLSKLKILFVVFIILAFLLISRIGNNSDFSEPIDGTYRSDEEIFLKTFYLMKHGNDYYASFKYASENGSRKIGLTHDASLWRLPTIFYIWSLTAANGYQIFTLFWALALTILFIVYLILKKFLGSLFALAGSILIVPYFLDAFYYKTSFLFTEWWGLFFYLIGICLLVYQKKQFVIFFVLAVIVRELFIVPVLFLFVSSLILKKNRLQFLLVIVCAVAFLQIHKMFVSRQDVLQIDSSLVSRLHGFDRESFLSMISFSMRKYPFAQYKFHYAVIVLSALSFLVNYLNKGDKNMVYIFLSGFAGLLVFPFMTTSVYNDYWGITFMPIIIVSTVLILAPFRGVLIRKARGLTGPFFARNIS